MSDFETKLDQAKMPERGALTYEKTMEDQIRYLEELAEGVKMGYDMMLAPGGTEYPQNNITEPPAGFTVD